MNIRGTTQLAGVIGWPVAHSRSPLIHNYWIAAHRLDAAYVPLPVAPDRAAEAIRALPALGFRGANVTIPHKRLAFDLCDHRDATAQRTGAVNTLIVRADGTLEGRNTDVAGFTTSLIGMAPEAHWRGQSAVVLGAGGAARAILASLEQLGFAQVQIANRTRAAAVQLAEAFSSTRTHCTAIDWDERQAALAGAKLVVNATSLGMTGKPTLDLDLAALKPDAAVAEIVYTPLMTPLLQQAAQRGLRYAHGLSMLIGQARPAFAAWFGVMPDADTGLEALLRADLEGPR